MDYYIIMFDTVNDAMRAEKLTAEHGGRIIPVPAEIADGCGFAIKIKDLEPGLGVIEGYMKHDGVYGAINIGGYKRIITKSKLEVF